MIWYSQNKWGIAKKSIGFDGIKYDSLFEAEQGNILFAKKKAKEIKDYEAHYKIPIEVNGYHICNYYIDFLVTHLDDTQEFIEVKGLQSEVWKIKWKLFCALYEDDPNTIITLIQQGKQRPPKIRKIKK